MRTLARLQEEIIACRRCPRLCAWGADVARARRRAFQQQAYWARPVPSFGDPRARLLLVGLAPAAHGAHRTGRMFTGDRSGDFLFAALHRAGFASQAESRARGDGLMLRGAYLTASVRCAPPQNRPAPAEFAACRVYLARELELLPELRVILALGRMAHAQVLAVLGERAGRWPFAHAAEHRLGPVWLLDSYHPSQQNTFTGRLTPAMLDAVLARARALVN